MYFYPYLLHILNLLSFTHYNTIDESQIVSDSPSTIPLWSLSRWSYSRYKGTKTFTASYNYYTKTYTFAEKRYLSYDELVNDAYKL